MEAPSYNSGGGIGIIQSLFSLSKCGIVDYIGPKIDEAIENQIKINKSFYLNYDKRWPKRLLGLKKGIVSGYCYSLLDTLNGIDFKQYDFVHIEFSKYPYLIKLSKKNGVKTLVRMHNVEKDYYLNQYKNKKTIANFLQSRFFSRMERRSVKMADSLICLTQTDIDRVHSLYENITKSIYCNPVCITDKNVGDLNQKKANYFLITGSLWFGPNADGILWFLREVWSSFSAMDQYCNFKLVIAGSRPNNDIISASSALKNVVLLSNPAEMSDLFLNAFAYVAPIFSGAGMKVKIAEALMYGLPILSTDHAMVGYVDSDSIYRCNTKEQFINSMRSTISNTPDDYERICIASRKVYLDNYSIDSSSRMYQKIFTKEKINDDIG
ncbi:glycosyltransferase [bacterium]|nr:glycosyltransferase [bacterium]